MGRIIFHQYVGEVMETIEAAGVKVDIIRHRSVHQDTIDGQPVVTSHGDYEAARSGQYTILPPEIFFRTEDGDGRKAGHWASAKASRIDNQAASLGHSTTIQGAKSAARRTLESQELIARHGEKALREVGLVGLAGFQELDPDTAIHVGDIVAGRGFGQFRRAVAVRVTPGRVRYLFTTPSSNGHLAFASGTPGAEVRLIRREARK